MNITEVIDILKDIKEFQFTQYSSVYNMKVCSESGMIMAYGTGINSSKGHCYGEYTMLRIAEWLANEPNRHKINGMRIEEFYADVMELCSSDFDVLDVL